MDPGNHLVGGQTLSAQGHPQLSVPVWNNGPSSHALYTTLKSALRTNIQHYTALLESATGVRPVKGRTVTSPFASTLQECLADLARGWEELQERTEITEDALRQSVFWFDFYMPTLWITMGRGPGTADELVEVKRLAFCVAENVDELKAVIEEASESVKKMTACGKDAEDVLMNLRERLGGSYGKQTGDMADGERQMSAIDEIFANLGV